MNYNQNKQNESILQEKQDDSKDVTQYAGQFQISNNTNAKNTATISQFKAKVDSRDQTMKRIVENANQSIQQMEREKCKDIEEMSAICTTGEDSSSISTYIWRHLIKGYTNRKSSLLVTVTSGLQEKMLSSGCTVYKSCADW